MQESAIVLSAKSVFPESMRPALILSYHVLPATRLPPRSQLQHTKYPHTFIPSEFWSRLFCSYSHTVLGWTKNVNLILSYCSSENISTILSLGSSYLNRDLLNSWTYDILKIFPFFSLYLILSYRWRTSNSSSDEWGKLDVEIQISGNYGRYTHLHRWKICSVSYISCAFNRAH